MKQSTRLIINVCTMITRMVLTVGIGLVATRLLLKLLGEVDFGLMSALGATGVMLQSLTMALTTSAQRHFAYEIGREDEAKLVRVFNTSFVLLAVLTGVTWLVGFALAPVIMHFLKIPDDRITTAWWVYQVSLITLVVTVITTCYRAMLVANQELPVIAGQSVLFSVLRFGAILLLLVVPGDLLLSFVVMQLVAFASTQLLVVAYCLWKVKASRPRIREFDKSEIKRIMHFAGWSTIGNLSMRLRMQGGMILLTSFFGPAVNTAYAIATQVAMYSTNLTNSIRLAIQPVIVGAEAKGNKKQVHRLAIAGGKYTLFLLAFCFVPLWLEASMVLDLWLDKVPEWTLVFVRLVMIWMMIDVYFMGYTLALQATGNIGWHTRIVLAISLSILIASGIAFYLGAPPWAMPVISILSMVVRMLVAVIGIGREIDLAPRTWIRQSLLPTGYVLVPGAVVATTIYMTMPEGLLRLALVIAAYAIVAIPLIWFAGMANWERDRFRQFGLSGLKRLRGKRKRPTAESDETLDQM